MKRKLLFLYKYVSHTIQLSWVIHKTAAVNLMVSFHTDHSNAHFNNTLQLTTSLTFLMETCAGTDTVLEIYSWNSLNVGTWSFWLNYVVILLNNTFLWLLFETLHLCIMVDAGFLCTKAHMFAVAIEERRCIFYLAVTM
jgi:hypothetical protein